jgi:hypothetical protein
LYIVDNNGDVFEYSHKKYITLNDSPGFWDKCSVIKISGIRDPQTIFELDYVAGPEYPERQNNNKKRHVLGIDSLGQSWHIRIKKDDKQKITPLFEQNEEKILFEVK